MLRNLKDKLKELKIYMIMKIEFMKEINYNEYFK